MKLLAILKKIKKKAMPFDDVITATPLYFDVLMLNGLFFFCFYISESFYQLRVLSWRILILKITVVEEFFLPEKRFNNLSSNAPFVTNFCVRICSLRSSSI